MYKEAANSNSTRHRIHETLASFQKKLKKEIYFKINLISPSQGVSRENSGAPNPPITG
jgi:hypothetical protein